MKRDDFSRAKSCKVRLPAYLKSRLADLKRLWEAYQSDSQPDNPSLGTLFEYGLSFYYMSPGTFDGQKEGYFCYLLSWGGPADEFRIFVNPDFSPHRVEYWFLDWFDGAHVVLGGEDENLLKDIYTGLFLDSGTARARYEAAQHEPGAYSP